MNSFKFLITILLLTTITTTMSVTIVASAEPVETRPILINCGLPKSTTSTSGNRIWQSDDNPDFAPSNINTISSTIAATSGTGAQIPYGTARLFRSSPVTYTFSVTPGPKFLRLYFSQTSSDYNNIPPTSQFFLSLQANGLTLLQNYNLFLNSPQNPNPSPSPLEFHLTVQEGESLNLTFSVGDSNKSKSNNCSCYGYVNGIEIMPVPEGLYVNQNKSLTYIATPSGYSFLKNAAFETAYRLNVGATDVQPMDDSGGLMRAWYSDDNYIVGFAGTVGNLESQPQLDLHYTKIPKYVAPQLVYATFRFMGKFLPAVNMARNLTWRFDVDPGFDYLVRLHFCQMDLNVTGSDQQLFSVYIGNQTAQLNLDVYKLAGGLGIPIYEDYVIHVFGDHGIDTSNGTKVPLWLALHPRLAYVTDVFLNGVEILKLSQFNGDLAVPNPPLATPEQNHQQQIDTSSNHNPLPIIGGVIGGVLLVFLILGCLVLYRRRAKNKSFISKNSSKGQWLPTTIESESTTTTTASSGPSLPSGLCRRFSLGQLRVATCDFDENLIIGTGGFGKVYKGSIDVGATNVAIKRLTATSKQGINEFRTEIEMLSRLRHVHLVSLIGYCDDQGEMILVYEYMPRGTLREHLVYKDKKNDNNEPLSWKKRLMVCVGSARGLHYLHSGAKELIIHRDVKSTNILLDDKWTAKVSDFGLSKVGPASESGIGHISTAVKGSVGYLDPEYYRRQQLTEKSDVYSFGVVLFEVLCARPALNPTLPKQQVNLAMWARSCYKNGTLHSIVDPKLTGQIAPECLRKFGEIAERCVRDDGTERPSMADVVWSLEFALQLQETAEKNNIDGDQLGPNFGHNDAPNGGDGGTTDGDDMFSNSTSEQNFSRSSVGGTMVPLMKYSRATTSSPTSISDYPSDLKSDSVFSEIKDPQAR